MLTKKYRSRTFHTKAQKAKILGRWRKGETSQAKAQSKNYKSKEQITKYRVVIGINWKWGLGLMHSGFQPDDLI